MFRKIVEALDHGRSPYLYTSIESETIGKLAVRDGSDVFGDPDLIRNLPADAALPCVSDGVLCERITTPPHLILCGGGHVSVDTAKIAKMVGFRVTVIDDREEFANAQRFPEADAVLCMPFDQALDEIEEQNAYYVIVTRGHKDDRLCLARILDKPYVYCGMIGSKTKIAHVYDALAEQGCSREQMNTVHAPIGLSIGAETPAEIAVCIVGEMIQVKNAAQRGSEWDTALCEAIRTAKETYAMVTLIEKHGSAPRAAGARMIVFSDGRSISSVGGGYGEFEAITHAKRMLNDGGPKPQRYTCYMNHTDAANDGMVCGGTIDILIQIAEG